MPSIPQELLLTYIYFSLWRKLNCKYISLPGFVAKCVDDFFCPYVLYFPSVGVIPILFNVSSGWTGLNI
jgi:hypothetical protein